MNRPSYRVKTTNVYRRKLTRTPTMAACSYLDLTGDLEPAVAACMDPEGIVKATNLNRVLWEARAIAPCQCVYVIGPADDDMEVHKIGYGDNPSSRLIALQIGNWHRLRIKGLIWIERGARSVEQTALKAAREMDLRLGGEWIEMSAGEAMELALKAARYEKADAADSAQYLDNLAARVAAVGQSAMIARAAA